jgi:hypothetical protein
MERTIYGEGREGKREKRRRGEKPRKAKKGNTRRGGGLE